ncbi:hypothetical protein [Devosia sp. 2618]|uniref:hypothetical protein n=1 Tax=Devosia sp. 2618 TaxID=3156454 RepID=UPI003393D1BB
MSILAIIALVLVVALPLATYYKPFAGGVLGICVLVAAALFFALVGKSAMTETTAAVFGASAFILAGLLAVAREIYLMRKHFEGQDD